MNTYTVRAMNAVETLEIGNHLWLGECPVQAWAQLAYDDEALLVRMGARERDIRAEASEMTHMPCRDSCLELFLAPCESDDRYINVEFNPNLCVYLGIGRGRADRLRLFPQNEAMRPEAHRTADGWELSYRLPFTLLRALFPGFELRPGTRMRGNCYKCGELTEPEHYISWNPVTSETPDFHRPQDFGLFIVE